MSHNNILRQQLEESHRTNEALTNDLQKLTTDWEHLRDDVIAKEDEWKEEELVISLSNMCVSAAGQLICCFKIAGIQ